MWKKERARKQGEHTQAEDTRRMSKVGGPVILSRRIFGKTCTEQLGSQQLKRRKQLHRLSDGLTASRDNDSLDNYAESGNGPP